MKQINMDRKNLIAQWAFDTRPILGRFHLWLENVEVEWIRGNPQDENGSIAFVDIRTERMLTMTAAVTALGTKLFGRYGEGKGKDKKELNQVKKDADAISAYAMSESLWYLTRSIPENHAIMVCLGEGLMPKAGETTEMGANPQLGFGRIYARPQVAKFLDSCVRRLINDKTYRWDDFRRDINHEDITVWGAAIDTLENTSRFATGGTTGPMTVLHLFNQPLAITDQYEGYMGNLILPREIVERASEESLIVDFFTSRDKVLRAIQATYPGIKVQNVHVWTLRGKGREPRIGQLWEQWQKLGVHLVDDDYVLPSGYSAFTESGTYAPTYLVGTWKDEGNEQHLFIVDGYAASAEALQAASLYPVLGLKASLAVFSSKFKLRYNQEPHVMHLDPDGVDFAEKLSRIAQKPLDEETIDRYRKDIIHARDAGVPLRERTITADDFISEKKWHVIAISGYMQPDPYSGAPGVEKISEDTDNEIYEVTVRISTQYGDKRIKFALRLEETFEDSRLVFQPLLNRFFRGENFRTRPVRISDSGRIRNELQTLCSDALEYFGERNVVLHFDKIPEDVITREQQKMLRDILQWYKENHPIWFDWLNFV